MEAENNAYCPKCGRKQKAGLGYMCESWWDHHGNFHQSDECRIRQLEQENAALLAERDRLRGLLGRLEVACGKYLNARYELDCVNERNGGGFDMACHTLRKRQIELAAALVAVRAALNTKGSE